MTPKQCIELINSSQSLQAVNELNYECSRSTYVNVL